MSGQPCLVALKNLKQHHTYAVDEVFFILAFYFRSPVGKKSNANSAAVPPV